jgi:hypothetical protein
MPTDGSAAGRQGKLRHHQHIDRIAVAGNGADVAIIKVVHGGHEAVDEDRGIMSTLFDRIGTHRNFDDHVEIVRQILPEELFKATDLRKKLRL